MLATLILPNQWKEFFQQFERQHHGWLVTVQVTETRLLDFDPPEAERRATVLAREQILEQVAVEQQGGSTRIKIVVGSGPDRLVEWIEHPEAVRFELADSGAHQGLRIDDADGTTTLVRFRTAADPELLDGLGDAEW